MAKADWELDIEHELKLVQCTECTHMANWTRTYTYVEDQVDVFTCRSCGHEMHIHHAEVDQVAEPSMTAAAYLPATDEGGAAPASGQRERGVFLPPSPQEVDQAASE